MLPKFPEYTEIWNVCDNKYNQYTDNMWRLRWDNIGEIKSLKSLFGVHKNSLYCVHQLRIPMVAQIEIESNFMEK